jgi:predicted aldo/keto reductase-like oxidoreductase
MDSQEALDDIQNNGIIEYMLDQKRKGAVRYLGASSHNAAIARKLVDMGVIDLLMFSVNAAYDLTGADKDLLEKEEYDFEKALDPQRMELYKLCEKNGVGITVMKSLGAGRLLSAEHTPFKEPMSVGQCIHYALTRPAVSSVLVGCASPDEVREAVRYFEMTDDEKRYSHIISDSRSTMKGSCVYCSHCQPCPANIDIAAVNKYLDVALLDADNIPPSIRSHYNMLKTHGSDCVSCGNCERRCPFEVRVAENMQRAVNLFGH